MADSVKVADTGQLYRAVRERLTTLLAGLPPEAWDRPVPACPLWTVHDVVAHLVGLVDDVLHGRTEGLATEPWTERQVVAGRDRRGSDLLAQWTEQAAKFEALPLPVQAVIDIASHEQDIRNAVGFPGERDSDVVTYAVSALLDDFVDRCTKHRLGPITIRTGGDAVMAGAANPGPPISLATTGYELFRARLGRRSRAQVLAMGWTGDPEPYLEYFFIMGPAEHDLVE